MHVVAGGAAFAHGFMLEHVRSCLFAMALRAVLVHATNLHFFRFENVFAVRIVTGCATHPPFLDRMVKLQAELGILVQMALEAGFGAFAGVDDQLAVAAGIHVQTAGSMATLAAFTLHPWPFAGNLDARVLRELEGLHFLLMARSAGIHPDVFG